MLSNLFCKYKENSLTLQHFSIFFIKKTQPKQKNALKYKKSATFHNVADIIKNMIYIKGYSMHKLNVHYFIFLYPYFATEPSSSSIRISWLYLAIRSVREREPVFICPELVATAISAIVVSSVSPERCEVTVV